MATRHDPYFFWIDRYSPFMLRKETVAHDGTVALTGAQPSGSKGKPMTIAYRLATAAQVSAWKSLAEGFTVFNTTSIHSSLVTGHTVVFSAKQPLTYQNELGLKDIDIGDTVLLAAKPGFNYWLGVMNLIIVT